MNRAVLVFLSCLALLGIACATGEIVGLGPDGGPPGGSDASGDCRTTCDGCCISGVCFEGNHPQACGLGGDECAECAPGTACSQSGSCGEGSDPCMGVTTAGRCASSTRVEVCTAPTGNTPPKLNSYDCAAGESCEIVGGLAGCVLDASCAEGATECVSATQLRRCQGGQWMTTTCPGGACIESSLGDFCGSGGGTTTMLTGRVTYQRRGPNSGRTDWGALSDAPGVGFTIASARVSGGTTTFLDSQVTGANGAFSLRVPTAPTANDFVIVYASGTRTDGRLSFVVADPRHTPRTAAYPIDGTIASPAVWSWSWRTDGVSEGDTLRIIENAGSGAARVFDYLRYVYSQSDQRWPGVAKDPLIVWLGMGVEWECGACQWPVPTTRFGTRYGAQIFIGGGDDDGFWSDAVTAHELGHWIMFTFGRSVGEGGRHCFGVVSAPGLAWSEGWATWFSSDARDDPEYVDKQGGTMFWLDISDRSTSGSAWPRPQAAKGLLQDTYENEVSAMMWRLSEGQGLGRAPLDAALATSRMTVGPFERGYTRQTWDTHDMTCARINIEDTGESTLFFADFLDALRCNGTSKATIDAVTEPATRYPYPSGSPICR